VRIVGGVSVVKLVILGGPGSGKGTQAALLCRHLDILLISTGEIFRRAIAAQTDLGKKAQPYVEKGELVPDPIAIELIRDRLTQADTSRGWLLDGYPRTAFQAEELDFFLERTGEQRPWAIHLQVPEDVLLARCLNRREQRPDDSPEFVCRRIQLFNERTIPILDYYDYCHQLVTVNGNQPSELVLQEILTGIMVNK